LTIAPLSNFVPNVLSSFSRNRARLLEHDVAGEFFRTVVAEARELKLTSDEHFTVDGTVIEAWASLKSFRPKGEQRSDRTPPDDPGNPSVNFHGERRRSWQTVSIAGLLEPNAQRDIVATSRRELGRPIVENST
jgi:hypothetical protein